MPDSPPFTDADADAFARLLSTDLPDLTDRKNLSDLSDLSGVEVETGQGPVTPGPPDDDRGDDGWSPTTCVMVSVTHADGREAFASTAVPATATAAELNRAARACTAGVLAQLAALDGPDPQ